MRLTIGYKAKDATASINEPPICKPTCVVQEVSVIFHLTMRSLYHYFRDNLKHLLTTLNVYGILPSEPLRLIIRGSVPSSYSAAAYMSNADPSMAGLGYLAAVTRMPIWTLPPEKPTCVHFERLIVGILPDEKGMKRGTGRVLRGPLTSGLRIEHCELEQRRLAGHVQLRPRITLLLRKSSSHGVASGRKVLNPDEVVRALSTLGPVRSISFEGLSLAAQLQVMTTTDVLVGVHGAGLSNSMFLHKCGVLVEMWPFGNPPAGAYIDFHVPYVSYKDTFCNVTAESERGCKLMSRSSARPLLVNTTILRNRLLEPIARWRSCYGIVNDERRAASSSLLSKLPTYLSRLIG